jgi:cyanophycinase-like exopeptidase
MLNEGPIDEVRIMEIGRVLLGVLFALASSGCADGGGFSSEPLGPIPPIEDSFQSPDLKPQVVFYPRVGNPADDIWGATGPGIVLMNDAVGPASAYAWMHATVDRSRIAGDVVVLCTRCADVYSSALYQLAPFNSVQTVLVPSQSVASDIELVADLLKTVEIVVLTDGELSVYLGWGSTPISTALQNVYHRGGVLAGAGAGATALGWAVLSAPVASATALANPYAPQITLARGPFGVQAMAGTFVQLDLESKDDLGVLAAMTARSVHDGLADTTATAALGIGLDAHAALAFDDRGNVTLLSDDEAPAAAWILQGGGANQIEAGQPLLWSNATVSRFDSPGESLRLGSACGTAFTYQISIDGAATPPFTPANPYEAQGKATPCAL